MRSNGNSQFATGNRRAQRRVATTGNALTVRDLNGHALRRMSPAPPLHSKDPVITRKVRLNFGWACTFAVPTSTNAFTYAQIAGQDAADYAVAGPRYQYIRIEKTEVWVNTSARTTVSATGNGSPSNVQLTDLTTGINQVYEDTPGLAVDWAAVGFVPDLQQRQAWLGVGSATQFASLAINSSGLAAGDSFGGTYVADFTVSLR